MYKRYVRVTGTPYERGKKLGELTKLQILTNLENQKKYYAVNEQYNYEDWFSYCQKYSSAIKKWAPEVWDEMRGVSAGSGINLECILALSTAYEKSFDCNLIQGKCTSFGVTGKMAKNGYTYLAQTNDENFTEWLNELDLVVHHIDSDSGTETLLYTHPGVPAYMGMNNNGLAVLWTYIDNGIIGDGLPTNVIIRKLLLCKNVDEGIQFLKTIPHEIPNQFGIGDCYGNISSVECYPNNVYVDENPESNYFIHTNNNVISNEPEKTCSCTTYTRYEEIQRQIRKNRGEIDSDVCFKMLSSHEHFPDSICVHPSPERPWNKTMAAMCFDLQSGVMKITYGNPCENLIHDYKFDHYIL